MLNTATGIQIVSGKSRKQVGVQIKQLQIW